MGKKKVKKEEEVKKEPVGSIVSELPEKTIAIKITKKGFRYDVAVSKDSEAVLGGFKISSLKIVKSLVFEVLEHLLKEADVPQDGGADEEKIYKKKQLEHLIEDAKQQVKEFKEDADDDDAEAISSFTEQDYKDMARRYLEDQLSGSSYDNSWYDVICEYLIDRR